MLAISFILAAALPAPTGYEGIGWIILALGGIVALFGGLIAAINGLLGLIEKIRGNKQSVGVSMTPDGFNRVEFNMHLKQIEDLKVEQKVGFTTLGQKIDGFSSDNYKSRRRMHKQINRHDNALHFLAGRLSGKGDQDGARLKDLLQQATSEEEGGDDE